MTGKKLLTLVLRVTVSAVMLSYLVYKIEESSHTRSGNRGVLPPWNKQTAAWLGLALILTFVAQVLASFRWRAVLEVLKVEKIPNIRYLTTLHLSGQFVGNVLPSTVGGDVLRVSRLSSESGDGPSSFASVIFERLTGWVVLPVLIFAGFAINRGFLKVDNSARPALIIAVANLVLLLVIMVFLASPRLGRKLGQSEGWRSFATAVHFGAKKFRSNPRSIVHVLVWAFVYQLVVVTAAFSAARTLGVHAVGFTAILTFFPAVLIIQVIPISIGGLGLREGLFVLFLHPLGVPDEKSVALGILIYLLTLVVSMFGAPSFAFGRRKARQAAAIESHADPGQAA